MTGIDTNILIRYITKDDPQQADKAAKFLKSLSPTNKGFISLAVIVECIWVLDSIYEQDRDTIAEAILKLTKSPRLTIQCGDEIETVFTEALSPDAFKGDLSDAIIAQVGYSHGCEQTVTFDKKASKLKHMTLL